MAFLAYVKGVDPSMVEPTIWTETCNEGPLSESNEELNLQKAHSKLFKECVKHKKNNNCMLKKLNEVMFKNESLHEQVNN